MSTRELLFSPIISVQRASVTINIYKKNEKEILQENDIRKKT